jgi:site-specific DNA-methyltransferase (adenine-specific)
MDYNLIKQDCIEWMNSQPEKSIQCIITSPPYNLNIKYGKYQDDQPREGYLKWIGDVARAAKRVLTDDGHVFLNVGYSNTDPWVAMDVAQVFRQEFVLQNNFTWIKHILVNGQSQGIYKPIASERFASATTESVFHFTKDGNVKVDRLAIGHRNKTHEKYPELYSESRHIAENRRKISRKLKFKTWLDFQKNATDEQKEKFAAMMIEQETKSPWDPDKKKCIGNAWFVPYTPVSKLAKEAGEDELGTRESGRGGHPATFPEQLPEMCIKFSGIVKGSIVYDPFNGTGTTVLSAIKNEMQGIGTDIDDEYLAFSKKRIESYIKTLNVVPILKKEKKAKVVKLPTATNEIAFNEMFQAQA